MIRSFKLQSNENGRRLLSPLECQNIGYSPDIGVISKPITQIPRKSSLIDLRKIDDQNLRLTKHRENKIRKPSTRDPMSSQKILQIVKEAQQQLFSAQQERQQQPKRILTLENEGLNFTFAQNFSNRKTILKEFSAHSLKKKFFA